ncbi:hypothetical protein [Halobaculum magnesiiphilum]|uniref:Uncharacterized protein n=1 Tax=Halobaculum magnesiiphilum TaxID=1017351 RepID=A0A8T8WB65_9EURY|nr:hypothetical protein [Halobaculum magnesiiphilum]QZP37080.1 hypothetical protein K6T50_12380 [Halobaculum magnesiiphilum]
MSSYDDSPSFEQHNRERQRSELESERRTAIREGIRKCSRALERGQRRHYFYTARKLAGEIYPLLFDADERTPDYFDAHVGHRDDWNFEAVNEFYTNPTPYIRALSEADRRPRPSETVSLHTGGYDTPEAAVQQTVAGALAGANAVAEYEDLVPRNLKRRTDAVGFACKLGEHLKRPEMNFGDPVNAVSLSSGKLKSFYLGGTGGGKSTAASRQFEDYYRETMGDGRTIKCLDFIGMGEGENVLYDVPQSQPNLTHVREQMGLAPTFEEDDLDPKLDIYAPLSATADEMKLPHDSESGECRVIPFTIPASELSESLLSSIIAERVSPDEERTIRSAYRAVDERIPDWCLDDLAEEIRRRDELSDKHKKGAIRVLKLLQSFGFIRTHTDEHAIDIEEIYTTPERITSFTQATCGSELAQYVVIAYLLDQHWDNGWEHPEWPDRAINLRELSEIAMHREHRGKLEAAVQAVVEFIIHRIHQMLRKNRHIHTSVCADTQDATEVEKAVRKRFNRYVVFGGSDELIEKVFRWAGQSGWRALKNNVTERAGEAGIVSGTGPSAGDADLWGISPVRLVPPSWHHYDTDNEDHDSGWHARVLLLDDEELRYPDWDTSIPPHMEITTSIGDGDGKPADERQMEAERAQARASHRREARERNAKGESVRMIRDALPDNPNTGKPYSIGAISNWTNDINKGEGIQQLQDDQIGGGEQAA